MRRGGVSRREVKRACIDSAGAIEGVADGMSAYQLSLKWRSPDTYRTCWVASWGCLGECMKIQDDKKP